MHSPVPGQVSEQQQPALSVVRTFTENIYFKTEFVQKESSIANI